MHRRINNIKNNVSIDFMDYKWFMTSAHDKTLTMLYATLDL